jgi:arabinofuranan 3-O-arabinosyltransferase
VTVQTQVTGTVQDLQSLSPLNVTACASVPLSSGHHFLTGYDGLGPFHFTSLVFRDTRLSTASTIRPRSVSAQGLDRDNRKIVVGPGPASYVALASNYNVGWSANMDGHALQPVRVDGWKQGWRVPAGAGGTILVTYAPDHLYRISLLLGFVLLLGILLLAVVPSQNRRRSNTTAAWIPPGVVVVSGAALVLVLLGGPVVVALVPCIAIALLWPRLLPWVVAGAMSGLGVVLVLQPGSEPITGLGGFSSAAQLCAMVALAAVLGGVCATAISSGWFKRSGANRPRHARGGAQRP